MANGAAGSPVDAWMAGRDPLGGMEWQRGPFTISCDPARIQLDVVSDFLAHSYWGRGMERLRIQTSLQHALPFSLLRDTDQIGFARVISDRATFGYLTDVFVLPEHRGQGLGQWLIDCVFAHPELQGFRRWILATQDAHSLYERYGFSRGDDTGMIMQKFNPAAQAEPDHPR